MSRNSDLISAIGLLAVIIFVSLGLRGLEYEILYYPRALVVLLSVFTIFLAGRALYNRSREAQQENKEAQTPVGRPTFITLAMALVFVVFMPYLGFVVSSLLFLVILMFILGVRKISVLILTPAISIGILYFVFNELLSVMLPKFNLW